MSDDNTLAGSARGEEGRGDVEHAVAADVERVLVVVAHPDDAEFWAGGSIAAWTRAGAQVFYLVLTDGEAGGFDPSVPRGDIPRIRRAEQVAASRILGVADVEFLGLREGTLADARDRVHREIVRAVRRWRPQRLVTWSPEWNWNRFRSCHPDHLATGELALHAVYPDAGNRFALTELLDGEGLQPWTVDELWLLNSPHANHYVDVTDTFSSKVAAVHAHKSQTAHRDDLAVYLRNRIAANSVGANLPEGRLAEAFQVVFNR